MIEKEFEANFERNLASSRVVSFLWQRMVVLTRHDSTNNELLCDIFFMGPDILSIGSLRACTSVSQMEDEGV